MVNPCTAVRNPAHVRSDLSFPASRWTSSPFRYSGIDWELSGIVAGALLATGMVWSLLAPHHDGVNPGSQPECAVPSGGVIASGSAMNQDGSRHSQTITDQTFGEPVEG
jgi:hypothetical protein